MFQAVLPVCQRRPRVPRYWEHSKEQDFLQLEPISLPGIPRRDVPVQIVTSTPRCACICRMEAC